MEYLTAPLLSFFSSKLKTFLIGLRSGLPGGILNCRAVFGVLTWITILKKHISCVFTATLENLNKAVSINSANNLPLSFP